MRYRLKPGCPEFRVTSGPFAKRKFERGKVYDAKEVPTTELNRFELIKEKEAKK